VVRTSRGHRLPGTTIPAEPAPDLTRLGLTLVSAGAGQINRIAVTVICSSGAHSTLLLGPNAALLHRAAAQLNLV
jgi:hypothetical protein